MTIRNLEIFTKVADLESMSAAAKELYITQPSVSLAIAEIEKEYGVRLFDRVGNHLHLTPTGQQLYLYTSSILHQYKEMKLFLKDESHNAKIRIGATATIGYCLIAPLIRHLKNTTPDIKYEITVASTGIIEERLLKSELDIGLVEGEIFSDALEKTPVLNDTLNVICSSQHPFYGKKSISMKDLENEVFILREHSSGTRMKVEEVLKEHNISYQTQWNCYSFESIKEAILHNLGITIMSPRVISRELIDGSLWACMIDDVDLSRSFNLIYRKNKLLSDPMQQFIGVCTKLESAK